MDVLVMNRKKASRFSYANRNIRTAMISITDPDKPDNDIKIDENNVAFLLRCKFGDVVDPNNSESISKKQAEEIAAFVKEHKNEVTQIIVHCEGGVSRSSGVAAAIQKYMTGDDSEIFDSFKYRPNILCYRRVLDALM